jgi:hypothetical protein
MWWQPVRLSDWSTQQLSEAKPKDNAGSLNCIIVPSK